MDITVIIGAVITLVSALITTFLIPYIKTKTTAVQRETIQQLINIAVYAAEQTVKGSGRGVERKEKVLNFLAERGITYDAKEVDMMIEAAVKALKLDEYAVGE